MINYLEHFNKKHYGPGPKGGQFAPSNGGGVRSAAKSVGDKILRKKKPTPPKADIKSGHKGGSKSDNAKLSKQQKEYILNSGSIAEVSAAQDKLSNKELEFAVKRIQKEQRSRIDLQKQLSELGAPEAQTTIEKGAEFVEKAAKSGKTVQDYMETGKKMWNFAAQIHNLSATPDDKWFTFDKDGKPQANSDPADVVELVTRGSVSDIIKNKDKLTNDQIAAALKRQKDLKDLSSYDTSENAKKGILTDDEKKSIISRGDYEAYKKSSDQFDTNQTDALLNNYEQKRKNDSRIEKFDSIRKQESINVKPYDPSTAPPSGMATEPKKGLFGRKKESAYEQKLNQYEKEARASGETIRENTNNSESSSGYSETTQRPSSTVDTSRSYQVSSRPSFEYAPSDAVKDFIGTYYDQPIIGEVAGAAVDYGIKRYKQRKKTTY